MADAINENTRKRVNIEVTDDGRLKVDAAISMEAPDGSATEDKQDDMIASLIQIEGDLASLLTYQLDYVDSTGDPLPSDFETLAATYGYTGANLTTIVKTKGANTWTLTITYSGENVTATSQWVKA